MNTPVSFVSTRNPTNPVSFGAAMMQGLAPDGGLYVPESIPRIDFKSLKTTSYASFAAGVLSQWISTEDGREELEVICRQAFDFDISLVPIRGGAWRDCHVLELFHGPTHSFKDFGSRFMARSISAMVARTDDVITVLVATSGDTGSAVADGFAGQEGIRVILLYPNGQVSPAQERQLIVRRPNVHTFRVSGTFDDCQRLVKGAFSTTRPQGIRLTSANSINVGRLLPQMIYYAWAAMQIEGLATFSVPCGNLGNLTGGVLAALSGLHVDRFVASHNANSFFPEYLASEAAGFRPSIRTCSNAMDVGAPSNFERLSFLLRRDEMVRLIAGQSVNDVDTVDAIRAVHEQTGYLADPHTAVGLRGIERFRRQTGRREPALVLATAHPAKFSDIVEKSVGSRPDMPDNLADLENRESSVRDLPVSQDALEDVIRQK